MSKPSDAAFMLRDEAIERLLCEVEAAPFGTLRIHVDHGDFRASFATGVSPVEGEQRTNLTDALVSLVSMIEENRDRSSLIPDGESALVAVLRYSDHADPLFCRCGFTWGEHACTNTPPREEYRYDFSNPANAVVKLRGGYSVALDYPIDPYGG